MMWKKDTEAVTGVARAFPGRVIVDACQAFYHVPVDGVPAFNSPRKFFGVPDGGFAMQVSPAALAALERDRSDDRCTHLLRRADRGDGQGSENHGWQAHGRFPLHMAGIGCHR